MDVFGTYILGLLIGGLLLLLFASIGALISRRTKHFALFPQKEQLLYFIIVGALVLTSIFAIITSRGQTILLGIPLVMFLMVSGAGPQEGSSRKDDSSSSAAYFFLGFIVIYTLNYFQHDFHNSQTIIRGIDEPYYYFIAKLLGVNHSFESNLAHFGFLSDTTRSTSTFYHYFDLWLFKLIIGTSFLLDNDLNSYWLIFKPLTLSINFYILFLLISDQISNSLSFIFALLALYAIFTIPGLPATGNINNFLFYPKFFYALFLVWVNYRFFTDRLPLKMFLCYLGVALIIIPLSVPFVGISIVIAFFYKRNFRTWVSKELMILYCGIGFMLLYYLINTKFHNDSPQELSPFVKLKNPTYLQKAFYYMTRVYGVKIFYYSPLLLLPVILFFTHLRRKLIEIVLPLKWFFLIAITYISVGLFLTGITHFNREHWQFTSQFVFPVLLFFVILIVNILTPLFLTLKKLKFYLFIPSLILLFYFSKGIIQYHFVPRDYALSRSADLMNAIRIRSEFSNKQFLFGYIINEKNMNNEYRSNALFPFHGGLMYQISNKAIPVYMSNFYLIDSFFHDKTSMKTVRQTPFYRYAEHSEITKYEEIVKSFLERNHIKAFFIENDLGYELPLPLAPGLYHVLEDEEKIGKYYFHKAFFGLKSNIAL